jgi:hypothetical protein
MKGNEMAENGEFQPPVVPESKMAYDGNLLDVTGGIVEIEIAHAGDLVWISVNGITKMRICRIDKLIFTDNRD